MNYLIRTKGSPLKVGFAMRSTSLSADRQPNCSHAQLCAGHVDFSFLAGVAALASADLVHPPRDAQEGSK